MPSLGGPLVSYKSFLEMSDSIDKSLSQANYDDYKAKHDAKQSDIFLELHGQDSWFKEKYDPELSFKWYLEKQAQS